ncbi:MAG: dicarboxylate/amino acid:cation symporter [Myxococcales bacterium]|nr:dicarboxylate/amino acid:cation symporter [Myxococcales bacterium]
MKKLSLTTWILIALCTGSAVGAYLGGHLGVTPPDFLPKASSLEWMSKTFIRLIKMLVSPIIFSTLVVGLAGAGDKHIGRLLLKALSWFWLATAVAIVIGLGVANTLKPGLGAVGGTGSFPTPASKPFYEQVVPTSLIDAMASNAILQLVFFSVLFAMALVSVGDKGKPVLAVLQGVAEAMFKLTEYVMRFAPLGVFAAMAVAVGTQGPGVMIQLGKLVLALYFALLLFVAVLLVAMKLLTGIRIGLVLRELREPLLLAFSTTSSESALPKAIATMERLGVPPHIVGFVLPAGYSFNLDGSTLYLALASLFIAQATGKYLSPGTQIEMMLTLLVASKGVAAVPRASLVVLASTCATYGLKVEWIATILGVDAVMDMARTMVNVLGNCMASIVVGKWERVIPQDAPLYTGVLPSVSDQVPDA